MPPTDEAGCPTPEIWRVGGFGDWGREEAEVVDEEAAAPGGCRPSPLRVERNCHEKMLNVFDYNSDIPNGRFWD